MSDDDETTQGLRSRGTGDGLRARAVETDDTEGHHLRAAATDDSDDAEGHIYKIPASQAPDDDDVEGHARRA